MSIIEFSHLTLSYPEKSIFTDFSEAIVSGEFIGVFGPNGAGKSTLLRAILGLKKPGNGEILVFGKPPQHGSSVIGYMPQLVGHSYNNQLSARSYLAATVDSVRWGLPLLNKAKRTAIQRVVELVNAQEFIDRPFGDLSGGEQKRIALAEALLFNSPKILLLDEPLSGLDPGQQGKIINLIQSLQQELHITVLFTAHDLNPLLKVMQRIIYLAGGKAAMGTVSEVVTSAKLSALYGAPIEVIHSDEHLFVIHKQYASNVHDTDHTRHL